MILFWLVVNEKELTLTVFIKFIFLLSIIFLACACVSYKPGKPQDLLDGSQTGDIYFVSTNDYDFNRGEPPTPIIVEGNLKVPIDHNGGAIILSHGSGGLGSYSNPWEFFFLSYGFATFTLDHFGPRNVDSTVHGQVRVTQQQMASDIIHAGNLLASDPRIKAGKIFHIGWSKGASAGLAAAAESSANESQKNNPLIAGYIAFYPYCGYTGDVSTHAKVLLLHGSEDNWTPLAPCERLVSEMQAIGSNVTLKVFEGAHHGFDNWNSDTIGHSNGITIRDTSDKCTIVFSRQSHSISADGKYSVGDYQSRVAFLKACGVRGVNYGGSPRYRKEVEQAVIDFVEE